MKPLLIILFLFSMAIAKTAGGNTISNSCCQLCWKTNVNNTCLIKAEESLPKKKKKESDISLSSVWDGKMLLL